MSDGAGSSYKGALGYGRSSRGFTIVFPLLFTPNAMSRAYADRFIQRIRSSVMLVIPSQFPTPQVTEYSALLGYMKGN